MKNYVTAFSRSLTSYSYMIGSIIQKFFTRKLTFYYVNHCGQPIGGGYRNHCESSPYIPPNTNHCGQPIGGGYRGHC